jgi:2-phosphoglycerate kinase
MAWTHANIMTHNLGDTPPWTVLLLGGHSAVGKTVVARQLARMYGVGLVEVDDVRLVLQRVTTPEQQPILHSFLLTNILEWSAEMLRDRLIAVNRIVASALEIVVANHVATNSPCILEGDGILPAFAAQTSFADLDVGSSVRAVFVVEHSKERIYQSMKMRGRSFDTFAPEQQQQWIELSWHYGQWLAQEAARYGLPVVPAQPWETLAARIRAVVDRYES